MNPAAAFLRACELDVVVRKPGNVSRASPGHGMVAEQFLAAARAAVGPLFEARARVGRRIARAAAASWAAAGCNTNLGIVLLCAPIAAAAECPGALAGAAPLRDALESVLAGLDLEDARAAFAAIAGTRPGGLGAAPDQDVHAAPSVGLRAAMTLAAGRDSIARQYENGFADCFDALPALAGSEPEAAVQRLYLHFLARLPDSHIARKQGPDVAQAVMAAARSWRSLERPALDPRFAVWDESLKSDRINPGTSADLTVAALLLAGLLDLERPGL